MKNKNKNITTKFRKSKSGGKSGVVSALDYTRLLPSVQYVKNRSCSATMTITIYDKLQNLNHDIEGKIDLDSSRGRGINFPK